MSSTDDGLATAMLELLSGYPAYFYSLGDGDYIYAIDRRFGLPIRTCGDSNPDLEWMCGFNRGVKAYVKRHGSPWNSRLPSLDVLVDLAAFFHHRAPEAVRLQLKGAEFRPEGFGFALTLDDGPMGVSVKLRADSLFKDPDTVPCAMRTYRSGPPPALVPTTPSPPAVGPGTELVWLRWFDDARRVDCLPARLGSHLVVFRFSDFVPHSEYKRPWAGLWGPQDNELFAALDTQLADWIPSALSEPLLEWQAPRA